jgi:hypothetical protein
MKALSVEAGGSFKVGDAESDYAYTWFQTVLLIPNGSGL